ncbi:ChaB family protein [Kocuria palustris]|uniref:ChaB family protein n=1 Tax=Kocuria palustris TaxID=71999 RepID=UPI0006AA5AD5|nr:ChaB family protein [Kocuria palustris]ALB03578.1 cation transport regulator ChaB [Kocuria palustris]
MSPTSNADKPAEREEIPSTLERSDQKAQDTYAAALENAREEYGSGAHAHQTAWAAVKRTHEKVGGHWEPKDENGPSDERSENGGRTGGESAGGVDADATKDHLYEVAQRLEIEGRSEMTKDELVEAIQKANDRKTAQARED